MGEVKGFDSAKVTPSVRQGIFIAGIVIIIVGVLVVGASFATNSTG